jgi:putative redox protein
MADGPITKWTARLREGHVFIAGPEGRSHVIDGDSKIAPGPVEVLLEAIMTCSGLDVVDILAKRRTPVDTFSMEVTAHRRAEHPRRIMALDIDYIIEGRDVEAEQAERAIQLAFEKYCTVIGSLGSDIVSHSRLVLNGQAMERRSRSMFGSPVTPRSNA